MNRSGLKFLASLLVTAMAVLPFAGLDNLPRGLRARIDAERATLASSVRQEQAAKSEVNADVAADPALFKTIASAAAWPGHFSDSESKISSAQRQMDELGRLEKANRRQDRARTESLLLEEQGLRAAAGSEAQTARQDAAHWVELKRQLPDELRSMQQDYNAIHGFDLAPVANAVAKAETDWPDKKTDLDARLQNLRNTVAGAEQTWQTEAADRRAASAQDWPHLEFTSLVAAGDSLKTAAADLPKESAGLQALGSQLYSSWDNILVDMETRGIGHARSWDQQIRTVRTRVANAADKTGVVSSDEKWVEVSQATYKAGENDLGMAIEHKPAGKYDSEAERVAQPAGFAYIAPPDVGSNRYGYWDHSGGHDFWVFYGQYALLRDLLFNHDYRPLARRDWEDYRWSRDAGHTYYGRTAEGTPVYGSQGAATRDRYSGSSYAHSGGFRDSEYASKRGSYRSSPFASPMGRDPNADHSPRRFGRPGGEPETPHGFRPSPRRSPSFHMPSGGGRRFGRH
ncbi:MAG: hypothetical protein ACLQVN_23130 [Bryobacteraceae bacterium]